MNKPIMQDLQDIILDILYEVSSWETRGFDENHMRNLCKLLQAEYNIYFVEPDEPQVNLV